jgi:hypothetical protein
MRQLRLGRTGLQVSRSITPIQIERELVPLCQEEGIGVIPTRASTPARRPALKEILPPIAPAR